MPGQLGLGHGALLVWTVRTEAGERHGVEPASAGAVTALDVGGHDERGPHIAHVAQAAVVHIPEHRQSSINRLTAPPSAAARPAVLSSSDCSIAGYSYS